MHSIWSRLNKASLNCHKTDAQTKTAITLCWRAELVMLVHWCRDSWSNKLQHARKALFWLHSTPRNITWPLTRTSDLKWDYFTWSSPYTFLIQSWGSNYFFLCFPSLFLTLLSPLPFNLYVSPSLPPCNFTARIHCPLWLYCPSVHFFPPFHNLSIVSEMNTALSFGTLSSYRHRHQSLSLFFCRVLLFNLHFTSPTFLSYRSWEKAFLLTESSLYKKQKKPWTQTSVSELLNPYISMSRLIHLNLKCSESTNMQIWKKISLELRSSTDLSMRNIEGKKKPWIIQLMHFTHFLQHIPCIHTSTLSFVPLG